MNISFTICSNNYLAQAKVLFTSVAEHNSSYINYVALVDTRSELVDYESFARENINIVPLSEIGIKDFDTITSKFDIVELNTALKPSFFKFLQKKHPEATNIFYFDPDIKIFESLANLERELETHDIVLTPHIVSPIPMDGKTPFENLFLNFGLYNLGFLGVKAAATETIAMLDWWEARTHELGYNRISEGLFVDQLWMNFLPIFFKRTKVLHNLGYNAAPWNLHERGDLKMENGKFLMIDDSPLHFYHFSSFKFNRPEVLSGYSRYTFDDMPIVKKMYQQYHENVMAAGFEQFNTIPCSYIKPVKKPSMFKRILIDLAPPLVIRLKQRFS